MASTVKLYLDTSVLGAMFDTKPVGRKEMSQLFFQTVRARRDTLYVSDLVMEEIDRAPNQVRFSLMTPCPTVSATRTFRITRELVVSTRVRRRTRDSGEFTRRR